MGPRSVWAVAAGVAAMLVFAFPASSSALLPGNVAGTETDTPPNARVASAMRAATIALDRARQSGDVAYCATAETALARVRREDRGYYPAIMLEGSVLYARHRFAEALATAAKASAVRPSDPDADALAADSDLALGRYDQALAAVQKLVDTYPSPAAYDRIAEVRRLHGDVDGADEMALKAVQASSSDPVQNAWYLVRLGDGYLAAGHLDAAERQYRSALDESPGDIDAIISAGRARMARKDLAGAAADFEKAASVRPSLAVLSALGDAYAGAGDARGAKAAYARFATTAAKTPDDPTTTLALSVFFLDHGERPVEALTLARRAASGSGAIEVWDALAWALYANGRYAEARDASRKASRLGTKDARLLYHAGMIDLRLGDTESARAHLQAALAANPYFDLRGADAARAAIADTRSSARPDRDLVPLSLAAGTAGLLVGGAGLAWGWRNHRRLEARGGL